MTLPTKGRRKIVVDTVAYHWLVRDNGDHQTIAIEHETGTGQTLHITVSRHDYPQLPAITPEIVRRLIRQAQTQGWQPLTNGTVRTLRDIPAEFFNPD